MKNKKLLYILLPAVLVIWGGIFYRIYDAVSGKDDTKDTPTTAVQKPAPSQLADTTQLLANYRDPFLDGVVGLSDRSYGVIGVRTSAVVPVPVVMVTPPPTPIVVTPPVPWPAIQYKGMIQNANSASKIALLQMNGKSYMVSEKQAVQEVQITTIHKDSVGVRFRSEEKYFRK